VTLYLADTSAWHRSGRDAVRTRWEQLLHDGVLGMCSPVRLEALYSARGASDYAALEDDLRSLPELTFTAESVRRAENVQGRLASKSLHRGPTPIDLYIAAIAELGGAVLLHYDSHFDAIAEVTGQAAEWIAPRGTLD
jgi:predicted nucleic acid-binding protein